MSDLILRPHGDKWALQLRWHDSCGPTDYHTIAVVSRDVAIAIVEAGATVDLYGGLKDG